MYVEDVKDRSNAPKAVMLCMLKMSKIDQIHLRALMLCMSKMLKMKGKEHTHTFWLITSLILDGFSIRKKFWKAETESFSTIGCGKKNPYKPISDLLRTTRKIFAHFRVISGKQSCLIGLNTAFCPIFLEFLEVDFNTC